MPRPASSLRFVLAACAGLGLLPCAARGAQVSELAAVHRDGQTFLTWRVPQLATGWTFRVYASAAPITGPADLGSATLVAVVGDSSWCDRRLSGIRGQTFGYRVDSLGPHLDASQALCVLTAEGAASRYYMVSSQLDSGPEDRRVSPGVNALASALPEQPGLPRPVHQRSFALGYFTVDVYTLWTSDRDTPLFPAMANRPGMAFDFAVTHGGASGASPLMVSLHARHGNFLEAVFGSGAPGEWVVAPDDHLPNAENTFWWGYHEDYDITSKTNPVRETGVVIDYTHRRILHTLAWARANLPVDTARVYAMGSSMGAIGAVSLAFRRPEWIAAIIALVPKYDFSFVSEPHPMSPFNLGAGIRVILDRMWGTVAANLPASDGHATFETLNYGFLAGGHAARGVPPLLGFAGREDFIVGWAEKIGFYDAMREHRLGGTFFWDMREHIGSNAVWTPMQDPLALQRYRSDRSLPALHDCAADADPGDGSAASGDSIGTINAFVEWDTLLVDETAAWETTLALRDLLTTRGVVTAPESTTVSVTPRRLQRFVVTPGAGYAYRVTRVADDAIVKTGNVVADALGTVTVSAVPVPRAGCRLRIEPAPAAAGRGGRR